MLPLLAVLACGTGSSSSRLADLTNPFLGPDHSAWLIGPISVIASPEETKAYLGLSDDRAAAAFIEQFWQRRNPTRGPGNPVLQAFEERGAAADHLFSEAGRLGRQSDRGTIYVLYGRPNKTGFEVPPSPNMSAIEVWSYSKDTPEGLDGKRPSLFYRFIKRGETTVTYVPHRAAPRVFPGASQSQELAFPPAAPPSSTDAVPPPPPNR
ncbi:MAG TPA: GWxTD domain-containing protein [Thermoanaerobaculia bacterium]|nr:GWxTD domain-containing protein [Thermoanaerobaculia bacterium]